MCHGYLLELSRRYDSQRYPQQMRNIENHHFYHLIQPQIPTTFTTCICRKLGVTFERRCSRAEGKMEKKNFSKTWCKKSSSIVRRYTRIFRPTNTELINIACVFVTLDAISIL